MFFLRYYRYKIGSKNDKKRRKQIYEKLEVENNNNGNYSDVSQKIDTAQYICYYFSLQQNCFACGPVQSSLPILSKFNVTSLRHSITINSLVTSNYAHKFTPDSHAAMIFCSELLFELFESFER